MSTKYARARDTAYQWRSEFRKARQENRSLRKVLVAAQALLVALDQAPITPSVTHHLAIENLKREIGAAEVFE